MTPILYEKDEIDFTSQGLGSLVEIYNVDVEEQRNGLLQLTASYPVSGVRYADISVGHIILAKPNQRDDVHAFRIVSTELDISGYAVTIEADSITYDLTHNLVKHLVASGNGQSFMTALKNAVVNPSIFAFYSDIATSSTTSLDYVNPMEAIMGTTGSFLQIWGGELKRENRRVAMFNRRGRDNVSTFRLGKNISGLKYSVDISSLVTRIIPTKSIQNDDQTTTTLEGTPVDSQYINNYEQIYTLPLEFTDDTIKTVADLNTAAKGWFTKSANTGRDKPTVTIDIDVLSLQDSADYQDKFKNLESVSLTDTVTVYVPEYGVNVTAIVNELHYDPILDRVTKMTVGTAKQSFADSSRTQLSDLQDKIISVQNQADAVAVSANGKNKNYYGSVEPSHPQEGDVWFWVDGDKSGVKVFVNGEWVEPVDSDTQEKIAAGVTDAVTQAKAHTDEVKQSLSSDIDTAKSQAASQASTAEANAKSAATSQFTQAQSALSAAKTDLTNSIASEASARNAAVAAANSQAQTYANQAKADALNTIAKEVTDRQNAVSALDTKATNAVNQAKSDITDTINAISVGGRNLLLNSKILSWSVGNIKVTISTVSYDGATNMWHITSPKGGSDVVGIYFWPTNNVTNIITNGQQWTFSFDIKGTGVYSKYGMGVGIDASSPINKLSGNVPADWTRVSSTGTATGTKPIIIYFNSIDVALDVYIKLPKLESGNKATDWTPAPEDVVLDYTTKDNQIKETITQYQTNNDGKVSRAQTDATTALGQVATKVSQTDYDTKTGDLTTKYTQVKQTIDSQAADIVDINKTATSQASKINSISSDVDGTKQSISDIETTQDSQSDKINQITSDVNGTKQSITDIQTKDGNQDTRMGTIETSVSGVKSDFSSYKTTNDGVVKTAQTTAQTAVDGLKTKVSQTDYNTKTGQLQTDLTTTTQTANQAKTDIVSIKQKDGDQDSRMTQIESDASGVKTTVSDLQTTTGKQTGDISTLQQRADGFEASVATINNTVNDLGQTNQLMNTEFTPDFQGWSADTGYELSSGLPTYEGSNVIHIKTTSTGYDYLRQQVPVAPGQVISFGTMMKFAPTSPDNSTVYWRYALTFYKASGGSSLGVIYGKINYQTLDWTLQKSENIIVPADTAYMNVTYYLRGAGEAWLSKPMLVFESTIGTYIQGNYNNNDALAKVKLTADQAKLDLSTYITDADGRITKAQAGVEANATAITTKVSQTDYDKKTGELSTKLNTTTDTANGTKQALSDYKEYANGNISGLSSDLIKLAGEVDLKLTKTDYDNDQSILNTSLSQWKADYDGWTGTVSRLSDTVNNLGQVNQLFNTEFSPDFSGWILRQERGSIYVKKTASYNGSNVVEMATNTGQGIANTGSAWLVSPEFAVQKGIALSFAVSAKVISKPTDTTTSFFLAQLRFTYSDGTVSYSDAIIRISATDTISSDFVRDSLVNVAIPDNVVSVCYYSWIRGEGTVVQISQPMGVFEKTVGAYVQGNYNNNAALAQVKITADGINNFVRDASGNISSNFQTALSKTSIITGSTLATSIQKQTSSQISSAITDNNGKIISLINQDSSGVQIAGKNIVLDGTVMVLDTFWAKQINAMKVNANNITVGTLNGSQVNITNINASNIVSGAISGANLNINLNTGSVVFQKGRINSSDYTTDINIDQGYISTANGDTRALLTQGKLQLIDPTLFSPQTSPYLEISNNSTLFNGMAALIKARDSLTVSINGHDNRGFNTPLSTESFVGLSIGKSNNNLMPTKIGGAEQGVIISGGKRFTIEGIGESPYVFVGSDSSGASSNGDRIFLNGSYVHSPSTYLRTTSGSANVVVNSDGALVRSSSARKYKLDIKNDISIADSLKLIQVPLSTWVDKHEHEENGSNERYFGMIAEDLRDAGLEYLVQYGDDNEVEGINYDRVALLLIPLVKELKERIEELESKGK